MKHLTLTISLILGATAATSGSHSKDYEFPLKDCQEMFAGIGGLLEEADKEYLHKGIAERNFVRTFKLAEYVEVQKAKLEDGLLRISLFRNLPEAMKPQSIKIT